MRLILCGACGRMGHEVASLAAERGETVVCGVDPAGGEVPFPLFTSLADIHTEADAVIDFSTPSGLEERLAFCEKHGLPIVLGATGYSGEDLEKIAKSAQRLAVFKSANLSVGVHVLQYLVRKAARALGGEFDAEIVERHHGQKKDAPSGTALMLAKSIGEGFGGGMTNTYGRHGQTGARGKNEIGIHAVRGGNIVGEHEVVFAGEDEILTLTHSARSRRIFAAGALRAARWLHGKPAGLYDMDDLLSDVL